MLKNYIKNWKRIDDDMAADVAQRERSKIKCYASAFSNIYIYWLRHFFKRKIYEHVSKNVLDESYDAPRTQPLYGRGWWKHSYKFIHSLLKLLTFAFKRIKTQTPVDILSISCIKTMIQLFDQFEVLIPKCLHLSNS